MDSNPAMAEFFSGFNFTTAYVVCISAMINMSSQKTVHTITIMSSNEMFFLWQEKYFIGSRVTVFSFKYSNNKHI